ncbi:MAG: hypothetical protein PHT33_10805 [bacterium]|nr:hypothetical protein [bacterium]
MPDKESNILYDWSASHGYLIMRSDYDDDMDERAQAALEAADAAGLSDDEIDRQILLAITKGEKHRIVESFPAGTDIMDILSRLDQVA